MSWACDLTESFVGLDLAFASPLFIEIRLFLSLKLGVDYRTPLLANFPM
jgi:hypothetical protein